ncbi:hypothetical protein K2173_002265 [Erythroxylum novogranatense]|uniref:GH10 domain-containing protein n=1 Tax=Erythroxylum novogranatense TaxID=1862640 RepID=A0AAV8T9N2_9ROSI|nr:hypothetical protein K2173_002265 [Erythroxylum novogranatense]
MKFLLVKTILVFLFCWVPSNMSTVCHVLLLLFQFCLVEPKRAQYRGGIIENPDFDRCLNGWNVFGNASIEEGKSKNGNKFLISKHRTRPLDGVSKNVQFEQGQIYSFSAWIQISEGIENVSVVFRIDGKDLIRAGKVIAKSGCWSLLKGGVTANSSSPVDILFETKNIRTEIWIDSVSLQAFTREQWKHHQEIMIKKERKSNVRFEVTCDNGTAVEGAFVSTKQIKGDFPFGCAMNHHILDNTDYQKWFASRFKYTAFTNEMKWYFDEAIQGQENYTIPDSMLNFCKQNDILVRGHNVFWADMKYQQKWVLDLSPDDLQKATTKRIDSVVSRYKGQLIAWDVVNENVHFRFYEDKLGPNASNEFYLRAYQLDPSITMFLNDYNTLEYCGDENVSPVTYMQKLENMLSYPGIQGISAGIGLEGHFGLGNANLAYMRSVMDIFGSTGLPLWFTEVSVANDPDQAQYLEEVLREGYSHPAVKGIIMFMGPAQAGFKETPLTDMSFSNTPAGDVVDKLLREWNSQTTETKTNAKGLSEILMNLGEHTVTVEHQLTNSLVTKTFNYKVAKGVRTVHFQIC